MTLPARSEVKEDGLPLQRALRALKDARSSLKQFGKTGSVKADPAQVRRILKNFRILYPNFRSLDVVGFGRGCREAVTSRVEDDLHDRCMK